MGLFEIKRWGEIYQPNAAMLRFTMERQGFRVYQWSDMPGAVYGLRKVSETRSHWIINGALEITVEPENAVYVLKAGDRDFIAPGTWFSMRVINGEKPPENDGEEPEEPKPVLYLIGEKINR